MALNDRIKAYADELEVNSIVSRSHLTLRRLYADFGHDAVDRALDAHFKSAIETHKYNQTELEGGNE